MSESPTLLRDSLFDAALTYAQNGLPVFPCAPGRKTPITEHGFHDATTDPRQIEQWWKHFPRANIAMPTGKPSGLIVLDIDPRHGGDEGLDDLLAQHGPLPATAESLTASGGRHYYFKYPGHPVPCSAGKLAPGVDLKGDGGYVLLPPSQRDASAAYAWELSATLGEIPLADCPAWLLQQVTPAGPPSNAAPHSADQPIPEGHRNTALTAKAGYMRRAGMSEAEILAALQIMNRDRCTPPLNPDELDRIARSVSRYEPDPVTTALAEDHYTQMFTTANTEPPTITSLLQSHPTLREPVIEGLLRRGETMNIISSPKMGKSWLATDLALAIATGRPWLDSFPTHQGDVLIIDNELHPETSAQRIPKVGNARGLRLETYGPHVRVQNLRGQLRDLYSLGPLLRSFQPGRFRMIILDAFYRFLPRDTDENDNGSIASLYNTIDNYADYLGCSFVLIHHTSKGNQSGKSITDVGAGAGSQSRATDTHLVLRPHEEEDTVVLDAAVRSWAPVDSFCLRWAFPIWTRAEDADPTKLRCEKPKRRDSGASWTPESFVQTFVSQQPETRDVILTRATQSGLSQWAAANLLRAADASELLIRSGRGKCSDPFRYCTPDEFPKDSRGGQ